MSRNNDLKNQVYTILKDRLITCKYPPGALLNETQLAAEFELSRTPIREALFRLEQEELVQILPKRGIYVNDITIQDVINVFQTRVEIEPIALKMAAPFLNPEDLENFLSTYKEEEPDVDRAFWQDMEMHYYFTSHCGNPFIITMMQRVYEQSCRIVIASGQNQIKIKNARMDHVKILTALLSEEYDQACALLHDHLGHCREHSLNYFSTRQKSSDNEWNKYSTILK